MNLTKQQQQAVENGEAIPVHVGKAECVVVRKDIFDRVKAVLYDDGELGDEEAVRMGWESGKSIGWDTAEMAEYDDYEAHRKNS